MLAWLGNSSVRPSVRPCVCACVRACVRECAGRTMMTGPVYRCARPAVRKRILLLRCLNGARRNNPTLKVCIFKRLRLLNKGHGFLVTLVLGLL
jgi:hypothetical protein